jgi:hypothetical protein
MYTTLGGKQATPAGRNGFLGGEGRRVMLRLWRLGGDSRRGRLLGVVPVVLVLAFLASGCSKLTGGGWIQSLDLVPGDKATFGFTARCQDTTVDGIPTAQLYDGQFQFDDHAFNPLVRVHGDVEPNVFGTVPGETCKDVSKETALVNFSGFQGTFRTQSTVVPSMQGEFAVFVSDGGEPGSINGDFICVQLVDLFGIGDNYLNCGVIQAGNIQVE